MKLKSKTDNIKITHTLNTVPPFYYEHANYDIALVTVF